jgi:hypothetical protein
LIAPAPNLQPPDAAAQEPETMCRLSTASKENAMIEDPSAAGEQQTATLALTGGPLSLRAEVQMTPKGLLAVAALVSGVLLSTAVLVWAATAVPRRHPLVSRIRPR